MSQAGLRPTDLVELSGIAQSTASRWIAGQTQPNYDALRKLVDNLTRRHPELGDLPTKLLADAGYGEDYVSPPAESAWERDVDAIRHRVELIEDPAQRERVQKIIDRELKETADLLQRRADNLKEIIDMIIESDKT